MKSRVIGYSIGAIIGCCILSMQAQIQLSVEPTINTQEISSVSVSDIRTPQYREDFATLEFNEQSVIVYWGCGHDANATFMWGASAYPGFEYPMIIQTKYTLEGNQKVSLSTQWGYFEYVLMEAGTAFQENGNLICTETGKQLVNWGRANEILVFWNDRTEQYWMFEKENGTIITS